MLVIELSDIATRLKELFNRVPPKKRGRGADALPSSEVGRTSKFETHVSASKMTKPVLTNVERDPADLRPWPNNPRRHSKKQLRILADNMRRFGPTNPALIDENNTILAGHARTGSSPVDWA